MSLNIPYKTTDYMISGFITPEVKVSEGFDSTGYQAPAAFLPLIRFNQEFEIHVVISRGTPVAYCGDFLYRPFHCKPDQRNGRSCTTSFGRQFNGTDPQYQNERRNRGSFR